MWIRSEATKTWHKRLKRGHIKYVGTKCGLYLLIDKKSVSAARAIRKCGNCKRIK